MEPNDKERKRNTLHSFFRSSFKKKNLDTTVSHSDEFSQLTESDSTTSYAMNNSLEPVSPSSTAATASFSPSSIAATSCLSSATTFVQSPPSTSPPSARLVATNISLPSDISISQREPPTQPKLASYKTNKDSRSFHSQWYSMFPWLEYSIEQGRIFRYYCRHFNDTSNLLNRIQSDAFTFGYNNWTNAMTKAQGLRKHELSVSHKSSVLNYQQFILSTDSQTTVKDILDKSRVDLIRKNRQRLSKIASPILLCSRQSIPLRGHDENDLSTNRGNFIEILKWAALTDPIVNSMFADSSSNASYLSPQIQNEFIQQMANQI